MKNIEFNNQNSSSAITNIQQETGIEYAGILSIGMILSNCKNITGENINIDKIISNKQPVASILLYWYKQLNYYVEYYCNWRIRFYWE